MCVRMCHLTFGVCVVQMSAYIYIFRIVISKKQKKEEIKKRAMYKQWSAKVQNNRNKIVSKLDAAWKWNEPRRIMASHHLFVLDKNAWDEWIPTTTPPRPVQWHSKYICTDHNFNPSPLFFHYSQNVTTFFFFCSRRKYFKLVFGTNIRFSSGISITNSKVIQKLIKTIRLLSQNASTYQKKMATRTIMTSFHSRIFFYFLCMPLNRIFLDSFPI